MRSESFAFRIRTIHSARLATKPTKNIKMNVKKYVVKILPFLTLLVLLVSGTYITDDSKKDLTDSNLLEIKKIVTNSIGHTDIKIDVVNNSFYRVRIFNYKIEPEEVVEIKEKSDLIASLIQEKIKPRDNDINSFEIEFTESENPNIPDKPILNFNYRFE